MVKVGSAEAQQKESFSIGAGTQSFAKKEHRAYSYRN